MLEHFRSYLILAALLLFTGSCDFNSPSDFFDSELVSEQDPYVLLIKHRGDDLSNVVSDQVIQALDYTKIPYQTIDIGIISSGLQIPNNTRTIVITSYLASELTYPEIQKLVRFVAAGNHIVFTNPVAYDNLAYLQGMNPFMEHKVDSTGRGVAFKYNLLPDFKGKKYFYEDLSIHTGYKPDSFSDKVKVLATAANEEEIPFMTSNKIGLGEVIVINSNLMYEKAYRGVMFAAILKGLSGIPYQVANVGTIFLDDFPAPLYDQKMPPIKEEYDITHLEFVTDVWWPEMKAFADSFNIDYSAMTAFNYNANIVPPFDFNEWQLGKVNVDGEITEGSSYLARDIRDSRHELAFHGYNHFSLLSYDWKEFSFMVSALQAARKQWRIDNLGPLPTNYVPPTNLIDSIGVQALTRGMPSIDYMSSLYLGVREDGGDREFGPDPYAPNQIFDYPRITSGSTMKENHLFAQFSMQILTGVWNHFIHPDDVFQVSQTDEDNFESRNPMKLGWKSDPEYGYGMYQMFRKRFLYTNEKFPLTQYITATEGGKFSRDWYNRYSVFIKKGNHFTVYAANRDNYEPVSGSEEKHWFMYVRKENESDVIPFLETQKVEYAKTPILDGFLYQMHTEKDSLVLPDLSASLYYDQSFITQLVSKEETDNQTYLYAQWEGGDWNDTRLEDALAEYRKYPDNRDIQNRLIDLSIEFGEIERVLDILEKRLLYNPVWQQEDIDRLLISYGWEGQVGRAEIFLEQLWQQYEDQAVIDLKNQMVKSLGLFGEAFDRRWAKRAVELNPDDKELILAYTRSVESEDNWPLIKPYLKSLIKMEPESDSLYAYTLQRSFYYDTPDSTIALVEEYPERVYPQIEPFATNLALIYAYEANMYEEALYWASKSDNITERTKLDWISNLDRTEEFNEKSMKLLASDSTDYELRRYVGSRFFYQGNKERAFEILYPVFKHNRYVNTNVDTLIRQDLRYLTYNERKALFKTYPDFFYGNNLDTLRQEYRENEGMMLRLNGEYESDNFGKSEARGGLGLTFGNRRKLSFTLASDNLLFIEERDSISSNFDYQGLNASAEWRTDNQKWVFRAGGALLYSNEDYIPEISAFTSFSGDSNYTSVELSFRNVLSTQALLEKIKQTQLQTYREDFWMKGFLVTSFSATGRYYSNDVVGYDLFGRVYAQPVTGTWRLRPLAELSYANATESFTDGLPYYTPDNYFSKGLGFDIRYRMPDNFDYDTQFSLELLAKQAEDEGFFYTGRIAAEHDLGRYWRLSVGADISTSSVYRSNRLFFTLRHIFPRKLK